MTPSAHNLGDGPIPTSSPRAAFTPGPWLIHAERRWIVPAEDTNNFTMSNSILTIDVIAKEALRMLEFKAPADALPICQLRDPDERFTEDETLANGFLIAAAPELYEALESEMERRKREYENTPEALKHYRRNHAVSLAALAKARGDAA